MKKKIMQGMISIVCLMVCLVSVRNVYAQNNGKVLLTILTASNRGSDFDLDNDKYRDRLIKLFSYSAYSQQHQEIVDLQKGERKVVPLLEGYELMLTLQEQERGRITVEAVIRKGTAQYVNTILSILKEGVVFLGGPTTQKGALILVLERR